MKSLNKTLRALSYIFVLCVTLSCDRFEEVSMGLPSTITFESEGGDLHFQADRTVFGITIEEGGDGKAWCHIGQAIEDTLSVSYKWLTIKQNVRDAQMIFHAEPTNSTETRKLRIELEDGLEYARVTIKQKGMVK